MSASGKLSPSESEHITVWQTSFEFERGERQTRA